MQHRCKVTVIDKKVYPALQAQYLADPSSGACPFYQVGDEFLFYRYADEDTFWTQGNGTQCSEAWDCISRYIYTALQGGSIMRHWTRDERMMIACCNDGTRPVIFKLQREDYLAVKIDGMERQGCAENIQTALESVPGVDFVRVRPDKGWAEVYVSPNACPAEEALIAALTPYPNCRVTGID